MGNLQSVNELSVSSVVEELHALAPEARSKGLDDLCEKHPQITEFLKTKYLKDPLLPPSKEPNRPPQVLSIKGPVPKEEKLEKLLETLEPWRKDVRSFWITKSSTFIPDETCRHPLRFIYAATVEELSQKESCLRRRYLALFWFDCFVKRYPGRGYDNEYSELSREIAGAVVDAETSIISRLRCQVSAGRRYNKLTEKFGDGILLILPSSIGKSTLECKLPLDDEAFEKFVSPLLGGWEECAMMEPIVSLGARIRRSLLEKCPEQGSPQEGSISSHESEKRKAQPSPQSPSQKSKQRRKHPPNAMVWSIPTPISTAPPTTPHISEQVYHSEGSNKHLDSPETAQVAQR
ncbi:hypothetical protein DL98DRAFT_578494 [Cadophora sp. DSE1049]|nr:hypothetical protein DL98DRAFT_578494 [Cadophora sp. DSE1049]